jgi:hypothetical protein
MKRRGQGSEQLIGEVSVEVGRGGIAQAEGVAPIGGVERDLDPQRPAVRSAVERIPIGRRRAADLFGQRRHFRRGERQVARAEFKQIAAQACCRQAGEGRLAASGEHDMEAQRLDGDEVFDYGAELGQGVEQVVIVDHQERFVVEGDGELVCEQLQGRA